MNTKLSKISLGVLALTALALSRSLFVFFDDPEGPNLLVVFVGALFVYLVSLGLFMWTPLYKNSVGNISKTFRSDMVKLLAVIAIQFLIVVSLYFALA